MKKNEVNNKHKNKYGKVKTIISIWNFNCQRLPYGRLMKQKHRICANGGIQKLVANYWETY